MVAIRKLGPLLLVLSLAGCSKSDPPAPAAEKKVDATPAAPTTAVVDDCSPISVGALLVGIARDEVAKTELDRTAKSAPAKENFRKVYDSETAFIATTEKKLARLTECKAASADLDAVKTKLAKARENVLYLQESFPELK